MWDVQISQDIDEITKQSRVKFNFKLSVQNQTKIKNNAPRDKFWITVLDLISMLLLPGMTIT